MAALDLEASVFAAIASVDDPEYPGVSIVDLGLLETFDVQTNGNTVVELIPTFSGCPALAIIASDVAQAVEGVPDVGEVQVRWLRSPVWTPDRLTGEGRAALANEFTVAVEIGARGSGTAVCPLCSAATEEQSMFGPSRCRSVHRCTQCSETVEVLRA